MKNLAYYNGKYDELENMYIPMTDRICYFGDGIYDATYSRNYKIFALEEHIDRFFNSAKLLQMQPSCSKDELKALLQEMVEKMDTGDNFVYFQLTRGADPVRSHTFDPEKKGNLWINIFPKGLVDTHKKVRLITAEDTRFLHCNIKTLNLIPAVMASQKAKEADCFETILHRNGRVTECAHSNISILKDGVFITAPTDNLILPGISRAHAIKACHKLGIPVQEIPYDLQTLMDADEIIVTSSGSLCIAAEEVDGKPVGGKAPALLKALQDEVVREFMAETEA